MITEFDCTLNLEFQECLVAQWVVVQYVRYHLNRKHNVTIKSWCTINVIYSIMNPKELMCVLLIQCFECITNVWSKNQPYRYLTVEIYRQYWCKLQFRVKTTTTMCVKCMGDVCRSGFPFSEIFLLKLPKGKMQSISQAIVC